MPTLYRELLCLLLTMGYLRTDQIVRLLRLLAAQKQLPLSEKSLLRVAQRRLQAFWQAGLVRRIVPPVSLETRNGPPRHIYTLDKTGALLAAEHLGVPLRDLAWRPSEDESQLFLDHTLRTLDIRLLCMEACWRERIELDWIDERVLRRDPAKVTLYGDDGEQLVVSVIPDGFFRLRSPTGQSLRVCLETDLASTTLAPTKWQARSWRRKVLAYQELIAQGHSDDLWNAQGAIVLTVTTSANRRAHPQEVCEEAASDLHEHFWFTTYDGLAADSFLTAAIWYVAGQGEVCSSLLPPR